MVRAFSQVATSTGPASPRPPRPSHVAWLLRMLCPPSAARHPAPAVLGGRTRVVITVLAFVCAIVVGAVLIIIADEATRTAFGYFFAYPWDTFAAACGSVLGSAVVTRMAPPVVLWPNSVPCGPLSTCTLVTLVNWKSAASGFGE